MRKIKLNIYYYKILLKILFFSIYLFFFLSYLLYYKSLESCTNGEDQCTMMISWIKIKVKEVIFSCLIMVILFELIIYKVISRLHLIHMIFNYILFYLYSHGLNFEDHGLYNIKGYSILFIIFFIIFLPINALIYFIKQKKKKIFIFFHIIKFISSLVLGIILYNISISNCNDWPKGLNNTSIDNNSKNYGCQIISPKKCPYQLFKNFLDITKITGKECKNLHINAKQNILELAKSPYINASVKHIGYPLTNKDLSCSMDFIGKNLMKECIMKNLVDLENKEVLNKYFKNKTPEIEVDFSNNQNGEMNINLKYNKTLSEERSLHEINSAPYSNNILILYIDSVSRANSLRQLKKSLNFFEKFMLYNGSSLDKSPSEKFHSFQFFKYHSFNYATPTNYPILFYGSPKNRTKALITKYLKENGYITCFAGELCAKDNARIEHNLTIEEVYDHQFVMCDPNKESININTIRCLYGKQNIEHLYEYGNQFWRKYKDNRKFLTIVSNYGHEGTLQVLKYADNIIFQFYE